MGTAQRSRLHHCMRADRATARVWDQIEIGELLDDTISAWESWSELHQAYEGPWRDLVHQSGRVLQALSFQPTGAICAAATTSLPETEGGNRNWDYRYSWVRDASFTIEALWVAACPDEANEFFEYMTTSAAASVGRGTDLQIMFGIGGEHDLTERELGHLPGWRNSAPVRVGNGAWNQRQLDVYGELLNSVYRLSDQVTELEPATKTFLVALADAAARRWTEKDQGIWEVRGEPRDFVYSKLMCWVALERAIALAERLDAHDRVSEWKQVQDEIHEAIITKGWSDNAERVHTVVRLRRPRRIQPHDAARRVPSCGRSADARDHRRDRTEPHRRPWARVPIPFPRRAGRRGRDLPPLHVLARASHGTLGPTRSRPRTVFERAVAFVNDLGLLAEEVDPSTGELLGNFPQAFSHIGLVNAAWAISEAERRSGERRPASP